MNGHFGIIQLCGVVALALLTQAPIFSQITVDKFMGVNTRGQDPIDRMKAVGIVREYHNWVFNTGFPFEGGSAAYPNNQNRWNPQYFGITKYDDFYQKIASDNLLISPSTLGSIPQVVSPFLNSADPTADEILEQMPIEAGADSLNPASYIAHADYLYQYAARYGKTVFSTNRLNTLIAPKLHPNDPVVTGLGYIDFLEDWNEQDKRYLLPVWPKTFFEPEAYAAMLSADYDGHEQTLGLVPDPDNNSQLISTVGIKNADPTMKSVMGGLATADLDYIRRMVAWFKANRSPTASFGQIPLDVINIHYYIGNNPDFTLSTQGVSPEEGGLRALLETFTAYRDSLMPNTELWLSEFGYDTNNNSAISAPTTGNNSQYEVQAQWIIRSYLEILAAGFDRAMIFDLRDDCTDPSCTTFASSGILENLINNFKPKNAWYYVYTMKNVLTGMIYEEDLSTCQDLTCPRVYRFIDPQNANKRIYVVWSPTSTDTTYNYSLSLEGANTATLVKMGVPSIYGTSTALSGSNPTIEVTERPVFIIVGDNTYTAGIPCTSNLSVDQQTCSTLKINWDAPNGVSKFQLWYREGNHTINDFSLATATLVDDEIDANLLEYTVADLPVSANLTFFLIPEGIVVDTSGGSVPDICSIQTATLSTTCKIPLDTSWIFDPFLNLENAKKLIDEQTNLDPICDNSMNPSTFWGFDFTPGQMTMERLGLDLQNYYFIDAISLYDGGGVGELLIQTAESPNGPWTTILDYLTISTNDWRTFTNLTPSNQPIRYLRLIASDDDEVQIGELFLCGRLSNFNADIPPGKVNDLTKLDSSCNTISLQWTAPFDNDLAFYKIIIGNTFQTAPVTGLTETFMLENLSPGLNTDIAILTVDAIGQESDTVKILAHTLPLIDCETNCNPSCPTQLCLKPSWIKDLSNDNDYFPTRLVDEQATAPICGSGGMPTTEWGFEFDPFDGVPPVQARLDLQDDYHLDSIFLYDGNSAGTFIIEYLDENGAWQPLINYFSLDFNLWILFDTLNVHTRYLRLTKNSLEANINEIVIHGRPFEPGSSEITDFIAPIINCTDAGLSWTLPSNSTINQIKLVLATTHSLEEFNLTGTATSFTINDLAPQTVYDFFLFAEDGTNQLSPPLELTIQTPAVASCNPNGPPSPVSNLQIINASCDELRVGWQPPADNDLSCYEMTVQPGNLTFTYPLLHQPIEVVIPNLTPNTTYQIEVKAMDKTGNLSTSTNISGTTLIPPNCGGNTGNANCKSNCPTFICVEDSWVTDETPADNINPLNLFDEPEKNNPLCGGSGNPSTKWGENYDPAAGLPPIIATVNLQQNYILDAIYLFDIESDGVFKIEYQNNAGSWIEIGTYFTAAYNQWHAFDNLSITTQYLRFTKLENSAKVGEVVISGVPAVN